MKSNPCSTINATAFTFRSRWNSVSSKDSSFSILISGVVCIDELMTFCDGLKRFWEKTEHVRKSPSHLTYV